MKFLVTVLSTLCFWKYPCHAFVAPMVPIRGRQGLSSMSEHHKPEDEDDEQQIGQQPISPSDTETKDLNELLDTQFFDPSQVKDDSPLKGFANLVEEDYHSAEALFASLFITVMVILTQEVLRMQLYGDQYVPFAKGGTGGGGFLF